jgi:hypothetical protein
MTNFERGGIMQLIDTLALLALQGAAWLLRACRHCHVGEQGCEWLYTKAISSTMYTHTESLSALKKSFTMKNSSKTQNVSNPPTTSCLHVPCPSRCQTFRVHPKEHLAGLTLSCCVPYLHQPLASPTSPPYTTAFSSFPSSSHSGRHLHPETFK